MRDGVGKEVGWSAVCVKESDRVEKQKCPEKAGIYAPWSSPPHSTSHFNRTLWHIRPTLTARFLTDFEALCNNYIL